MAASAAAQPAPDEFRDEGVAPSAELRLEGYASPTPLGIPGASVVSTVELRRLLQAPGGARALLFDVLGGEGHDTLPGTLWLPGAGRGSGFDDALQARLARVLEEATGGDRARPMVFFCSSAHCWLSYNAALRAARLGYTRVLWYRGGIHAWGAAGGALAAPVGRWKDGP